jgi:TonB family protein
MPGDKDGRDKNRKGQNMKNTNSKIIIFSLLLAAAAGYAVAQDSDLKVSGPDAMKAATSKVQPEYPAVARQLRLEGAVEVEVHISEGGVVDSARPLTGNAILATAAVEATKRWKFTPFTSGGKPVKATAPLTFNFKL